MGNGYYDPPDLFFETQDANEDFVSTKMMQDAAPNMTTWLIPKPGTYYPSVIERDWFDSWWRDWYGSPPPSWGALPPDGVEAISAPRMRPFDPQSPVPPVLSGDADPDENRRWFKPNRGGWNAFGRGAPEDPDIQFDLGGDDFDVPILPEEQFGYFDGWVEHDDLPSSIYHRAGDQRLGEITSPHHDNIGFGTDDDLDGEEDQYAAIFGVDLGRHNPLSTGTGDNICVAAGPGAVNIHGEKGFDAGDVCLTEWLTWRRDGTSRTSGNHWESENGPYHPYAGPSSSIHPTGTCSVSGTCSITANTSCRADGDCPAGEVCQGLGVCSHTQGPCSTENDCPVGETCEVEVQVPCLVDAHCPQGESCFRPQRPFGFADYNLDGMIDQGEVRPPFTDNYSVDGNPDTTNDGTASEYPHNRRRMIEDIVEALDFSVNWSDYVDQSHVFHGFTNTISGIALVPPGSYNDINLFPREPLYYQIETMDATWGI